MKLSNLVAYRNQLDVMSALPIGDTAGMEIKKITHLISTQSVQLSEFSKTLVEKQQAIQQAFEMFDHDLQNLKNQLNELIETTEKPWFQESYKLYESMFNDNDYHILHRRPRITPDTEQFYRTRIVRYNSWQYPAMIIRPGLETYINELLATDPLYIVDEHHDLLNPVMSLFNENYQNRLRPYVVDERQDQEILIKLPNGQFGLVFAYNFFNYKPFEVIRKYLTEIYQKLKPGGVLAMTFNDCDREEGVELAENFFCCYTPGYLVRELAVSIGYKIIFSWTDRGPSTWLELQKPGEFTSLRGGQALAKIVPKPVVESK